MTKPSAGGRATGSAALSRGVRERARELGFTLVGITTPEPSGHLDFFRRWLGEGLHGEMGYLARPDAIERRGDLARTLPSVRSVVVVGHEYFQGDPAGVPDDPSRGVIARYARGRDYHKVVKKKLVKLGRWLEGAVSGGGEGDAEKKGDGAESGMPAWRAYVDTGPLLERELAQRAGLGWFGKNTMLIHPRKGSYFFLGVLLTDVALKTDAPFESDHCGSCRACLDACPTGALLGRDENGAPVLDATRCISYLTIEHRGSIPEELRGRMGNRIYGCDICQEVCPWNQRFAEPAIESDYSVRKGWEAELDRDSSDPDEDGPTEAVVPTMDGPALVDLMRMSEDEWDAYTRGSAMRRAGYAGLQRNVAIALGNWLASVRQPPEDAVAALRKALEDEGERVREYARWALEWVEPAD